MMDSASSTKDIQRKVKTTKENVLLDIVKELCQENNKLSDKLKKKICAVIAQCDLVHYSSLHKLSTRDASTSTLLGVMQQVAIELTFDDQAAFNQAVLQKIQTKLSDYNTELEHLQQTSNQIKNSNKNKRKELQESIDKKLNTLEEQESEKVELMMEWLDHRSKDATKFTDNSSELLSLKTKILQLKSKILHLQIQQNIFTETNQSLRAYAEIQRDIKDALKSCEMRIRNFRHVINNDVQ